MVFKQIFVKMARAVGEQAGLRQMRALVATSAPFTNLDGIDCPTVIIGDQEGLVSSSLALGVSVHWRAMRN